MNWLRGAGAILSINPHIVLMLKRRPRFSRCWIGALVAFKNQKLAESTGMYATRCGGRDARAVPVWAGRVQARSVSRFDAIGEESIVAGGNRTAPSHRQIVCHAH